MVEPRPPLRTASVDLSTGNGDERRQKWLRVIPLMPRSRSTTRPWLSYFRLEAENSIVNSPDTDRYRRFDRAADALRFAIEELPPRLFLGACLEVEEERFNSNEMRRLYDSAEFPLARRAVV
jgi:hypothetical protein